MRIRRAPTQLYDRHPRRILGRRFLRLTHRVRTAGREYRTTMLEVVGENLGRHEAVVLAARWYRKLVADNATTVASRRERFPPLYRELDPA